ncbi:MAG: internal scaffolding protein [Microvirus sp.]|nr:MAG: internal scaffolding protein [Microvirus sp.]
MNIDNDGVIHTNVRTPFNYDKDYVSRETGLECTDASKTQQQFKDETDINVILERFGITGQMPITTMQPLAGDFTAIEDYQQALNAVHAAEQNFMQLPSKIRDKFNQDSRKFVDFCVDPANIEAVRELGLAPRPPAPTLAQLEKKE